MQGYPSSSVRVAESRRLLVGPSRLQVNLFNPLDARRVREYLTGLFVSCETTQVTAYNSPNLRIEGPTSICHAWTDGSFRRGGIDPRRQTNRLRRFRRRHMITSSLGLHQCYRAGPTHRAGPAQTAVKVNSSSQPQQGRTAEIQWSKAMTGCPAMRRPTNY
jgi:hypothetical protein